jgi:hypothetical protein
MRALYLLLAVAACDAYDEDLGTSPYLCGVDEPRCPSGYTCTVNPSIGAEVCLRAGEVIGNFACADDSAFEPNQTLADATPTPVDAAMTFTQERLAICPARDKDLFSFTLSVPNQHVELLVVYEANGSPLDAHLLNTAGVPIRAAVQVADQPRTLRAFAQNLSAGKHYVQVSAESGVNNYKFSLDVTGP